MSFWKKNKKIMILILVGIILILSGTLSWNLYFSKFKIFKDNEKLFLETVERYYSMNPNYLPEKNKTREMTLQKLYEGHHISDLYVPKTKKLCDSNSWVRVYQDENGKISYTTYLKCGKFESNIDHTGPEITLNGESEITLALGSTYQEPGVSKVYDKLDGNLNPSDVIIDSSSLNTNKVGNYKITYTIRDKSYNKTVVTRTIIVAKNLTDVVKDATDETNYYKGNDVKNNYLLFSGMLFRIVKANDDGSIMIISDESVTNLRINHTDYKNSNVDTWLNNVYFKALHNTDDYLIDATYCVGNINSLIDYNNECDTKITSKVGLLSIGDYQKTVVNNDTYLDNGNYYALSHMIGNNYATVPIENDTMYGLRSSILGGIRPVLNLKSNLYIVSGKGTSDSPYKLGDYNYGEKNEEIHDRLIGEYLEYSGLTFRIIGVDSNKNVRLIMSKPWDVKPNNEQLKLSVAEVDNLEFNLTDTNNPGYILNHNDIDYISSKYIVDTDYSIPTNDEKLLYQEYSSKKIKAKILLPKTYELFSSIGNDDISRNTGFLYIDKSVNDNMIFMANGNNGLMYEFSKDTFYSYSIKAVITIKGSLKISSGNGTVNKPYIIK